MPLWQHVLVGQPAVRPVRRRRRRATVEPRAACGWPASELRMTLRDGSRRPRPRRRSGRRRRARGLAPSRVGGDRAARRRGPAAGDHVHLQPGRLRRRGAAVPARRAAADRPARSATRSARIVERALRGHPRRGPRRARLLGVARRAGARRRRAPRRPAADVQGGRRGAVRPRAWSRPCSPPRRWRSASTCRPAPSCSSGWSSGTARPTPTSRRGSTPSSPAGPGAAASTSRATPSCSGSPGSTRRGSPAWPPPAPTRCGPASGPSYNMAVNLVGQVGRDRARELLESSFAQFQADRAVVGLARQVRTQRGGAGRATRRR